MAGLDEVLARLINEPGFRTALAADPVAALAGYEVDDADLEVLAASLDERPGGEHTVEQRTSKSALLGMLGAAVADASAAGVTGDPVGLKDTSSFRISTGDEAADVDQPYVLGSLANPPAPSAGGEHEVEYDIVVGEAAEADGEYVVTGATHPASSTEDSEGLWQINLDAEVDADAGHLSSAHDAISIGDDDTYEVAREAGAVTFGDGERGAVPDTGDTVGEDEIYTVGGDRTQVADADQPVEPKETITIHGQYDVVEEPPAVEEVPLADEEPDEG